VAKKVAITGASGVLGMALALEARTRGYDVVALYRSTPITIPGVSCQAVDLTDEGATRDFFQDARPELIIHAAAEVRVDWCEDHPEEATRVNVDASATVADCAAKSSAALLYVSTDSVFDGRGRYHRETDPPAPVNVYAATKLRGEVEALRRHPGAVIARANFYGWTGRHKTGLVDWILQQLAHGRTLPGFTDAIFSPLLANDLAVALLDLVAYDVSGIFHVVGPEAISKYEFARRVAELFGYDPELVRPSRVADVTMRAPRPLNTSLDTRKVTALLGHALPDVSTGLRHFAELRAGGYQQMLDSYFPAQ
jgi:dTDP-4-dehydrorhamnose reductase